MKTVSSRSQGKNMLGDELKQLRGERRLGIATLARLSGISRPHLYAIESGDAGIPRADTLMKIARGLSASRTGDEDPYELVGIFRRLEVAAGYPVAAPSEPETVPNELQSRFHRIVANWNLLNPAEKDHVAAILGLAGDFGRSDSTPQQHPDSQADRGANQNYPKTPDCREFDRSGRIPRVLALA